MRQPPIRKAEGYRKQKARKLRLFNLLSAGGRSNTLPQGTLTNFRMHGLNDAPRWLASLHAAEEKERE